MRAARRVRRRGITRSIRSERKSREETAMGMTLGSIHCALSPNRKRTLRSICFYDGESQMEIGAVLDDEERAERLRPEIEAFTGGA